MKPKVSVLITSYNHAPLLRRAIDSVLMQKVTFPVEVLVVDDCSADGSAEIILKYFKAGKVSCVLFPDHQGLMRTYCVGLGRCTGEYIATCDSDDFWTSEDKLQRQVEVMDEFPALSLCVTKVYTETDGVRKPMTVSASYINKHLAYDNLLKGNSFIYAQSYLLRQSALLRYVDFDRFVSLGFSVWDLPIVLTLSRNTKFICLDFYSAVYTKNAESVTNTHRRVKRFKYLMGNYKIRAYFILCYGCKLSTFIFVIYKLLRDITSVILKKWYK